MKFPIAILKISNPIICVYSNKVDMKKTSEELLNNGVWDNCVIIDSNGEEYIILSVKKTGLRGIYGWHPLLKGKSIWVEFTFSESKNANLHTFKQEAILKVEKSKWFWEAAWDINDLKKEINEAKTFEELILLFK